MSGAGQAEERTAPAARAAPGETLRRGPILPTLVRLAAPNGVAMVAAACVSIAETAYVGRLGVASLAGVTLVFPLIMLMQMMSAGAMGGGISSAVSRALGAGDHQRVEALALCAAAIGLIGGLSGVALLYVFGPAIFSALGGEGAALAEATAYGRIAAFGVLGIWLTNTMASVLRGVGRMGAPAFAVLLACALQIVIGGALAFGWGPLPRLGVQGIGAGQAIAFASAALIMFTLLRRGPGVRLRFAARHLQAPLFMDILRVGGVGCLSPVFAVLTVLALTSFVAPFGAEALAGYGIGARLEFLLIPIAFAIGVGSVPMVGVAIGAGDVARARRVAWTAGALAAGLLGAIGLIVAAMPFLWTQLFTADPAVRAAADQYLRFSGLGFPFFGLGLCLYFASQGAGKVIGPILAQAARLAAVAAIGAVLLAMDAPHWAFFALVAGAMVVLGLGSALAVRFTPWGPRAAGAVTPA